VSGGIAKRQATALAEAPEAAVGAAEEAAVEVTPPEVGAGKEVEDTREEVEDTRVDTPQEEVAEEAAAEEVRRLSERSRRYEYLGYYKKVFPRFLREVFAQFFMVIFARFFTRPAL
jgi:hypothetical protein